MPYEDRRWFRCHTCRVSQSWANAAAAPLPGFRTGNDTGMTPRLWHPFGNTPATAAP